MLSYYVSKLPDDTVRESLINLNRIKQCLETHQYDELFICAQKTDEFYNAAVKTALAENDEKFANSAYVFSSYTSLIKDIATYFELLNERKYEESWNSLQDCLSLMRLLLRFTDERYDLNGLYQLLKMYETLYPYSYFFSSEYTIKSSHCSICGKSMRSVSCCHRKGELYWGELAKECIDEIETIQAVSIVKNPEDKRLVVSVADDRRSKEERFHLLDSFLSLNLDKLTIADFDIPNQLHGAESEIPPSEDRFLDNKWANRMNQRKESCVIPIKSINRVQLYMFSV